MIRKLGVLVAFLSLAIPVRVFAKAEISKITIRGAHLKAPIEITDPKTLANFDVWTGPGTSGTNPKDGDKFVMSARLPIIRCNCPASGRRSATRLALRLEHHLSGLQANSGG